MSVETNVVDSFLQQNSPNETPLINGVATNLFMARNRGQGIINAPLTTEAHQSSIIGNWVPTLSAGNQLADNIQVSGLLVNSIPFFALLGKADLIGGNYVANSRRDISNMTLTEGIKPTYAINEVVGSIQHTVYGCMFDTLHLIHDGSFLKANMAGQGRNQFLGSTPSSSIFPNNVKSLFDINRYFKWNSNELTNILTTETTLKQASNLSIGDNGFIDDISDNNPIFTNFTVSFIGEQSDLYNDNFNKTKRDIKWRMDKSNDPTHFFEISAPDSLCNQIIYKKEKGRVIGGAATFTSSAINVDVLDGLNDSFMKIPV